MQEQGVLFIKGIGFNDKVVGYAAIYKGEAIASGTAKEVREALKDLWTVRGEKLIKLLNELPIIRFYKGITYAIVKTENEIAAKNPTLLDEVVIQGKKAVNDLERRVSDLFDDLGGRLLNEKDLKLLKQKLKTEFGVDLRLIDKEKGFQKLPITKNGQTKWIRSEDLLKDWDRRDVVGKFHKGLPPVMILRANNASELTVFHEKVHLEVWFKKTTKNAYYR